MKSVLYYVIPKKIINGTLFYAMEYFLTLNEIEPTSLILKCDKETYKFILECFHVKYDYDFALDSLIICSNFTTLLKIIDDNVLILDTNTYKRCKSLIKTSIYLYSENGKNELFENTYGYYTYQTFRIKNRLKLALKYHRMCPEKIKEITSSGLMKNTTKQPNEFMNFMKAKTWKYIHNTFDTNNRFIIEARYFNKKLLIQESETFINDSIQDRFTSSIDEFILDTKDKLIKDFINE